MAIRHSIVQPEQFAWLIDPNKVYRRVPQQAIINAAKPICDWLVPKDVPLRIQLELKGDFRETGFTITPIEHQLRRNAFRFAPLMSLHWRDEIAYLYVKGQVALVTNGKTIVLQYRKEDR